MLEIKKLSHTYPDGTEALRDVSFTVEDGEFLVVIGLSGSGKSTLLRCINRLLDPTSGNIIWNGADATALKHNQLRPLRREIGMIFQHFNLVKRSNVMTNVKSNKTQAAKILGIDRKTLNSKLKKIETQGLDF